MKIGCNIKELQDISRILNEFAMLQLAALLIDSFKKGYTG